MPSVAVYDIEASTIVLDAPGFCCLGLAILLRCKERLTDNDRSSLRPRVLGNSGTRRRFKQTTNIFWDLLASYYALAFTTEVQASPSTIGIPGLVQSLSTVTALQMHVGALRLTDIEVIAPV